MKKFVFSVVLLAGFILVANSFVGFSMAMESRFDKGTPAIESMSALAFAPEGVLLIGDSNSGAVFAVDLDDKAVSDNKERLQIKDIEGKIASLLGTTADQIMIHDMAVNPLSQNIYLSVSRGGKRADWAHSFILPNDLDNARILLKVTPNGMIDEVPLQDVNYSMAKLPNPVAEDKMHKWKEGVSLRVETITDMVYHKGKVFVAGLSNEEFASAMWQIPYPFEDNITATTIEIFHGAHGKYETHSPIRTFLPYELNNEDQLLAAYLCTPLVTIPIQQLENGTHVKGRTVAEFGSGNYPLDMLVYKKNGKEKILIANSNLPVMIVDPDDIASYKGAITEEVDGYVAGVDYEIRSGLGIQQLDNFNSEFFLALQRMPNGRLDMQSYPIERF